MEDISEYMDKSIKKDVDIKDKIKKKEQLYCEIEKKYYHNISSCANLNSYRHRPLFISLN